MNPDSGYTERVTKRLVDIDDELLEKARAFSGATTIKGTVAVALQRLVDQNQAILHVKRLRQRGALDWDSIERARSARSTDG
jgi:Arc/MetJ family transcription regulator